MKTVPHISVIVPCYNSSQHILPCIHSILGQSYTDWQLLLVNDGSTEIETAVLRDMANLDERITLLHQQNQGVSVARNLGLKYANGRFVAFLDADDYWAPTFLSDMYKAAIDSGNSLCYCGWQNVGQHRDTRPFIPPDYEQKKNKRERLFESCRWPIHATLVETRLVINAGGFEPGRQYCEDFKLWLNIALDRPITRVPKVLAYYRHHSLTQSSSNLVSMLSQHLQVQQQFMRNHAEQLAGISRSKLRHLSLGFILKKAYAAYWRGDLQTAQAGFRLAIHHGYGSVSDWRYLLPSLLPPAVYRALIIFKRNTYV